MAVGVTLPLWLVILAGVLALIGLLDRLLVPSVRWFIRSRANKVLDEVGSRLRIEIRPFQHTRRQALIDRLLYDDKVQQAAAACMRAQNLPRELIALGLTKARTETIRALARTVADGELRLEPGVDVDETIQSLQALPGIGAWTAHYIAMRALGYPDAFPYADLGLMKALGLRKPRDMLAAAEPWRPWRAYAAHHLWASLK